MTAGTIASSRYLMWTAVSDSRLCKPCNDLHGKIYEAGEPVEPKPPQHPNCRCQIEWLRAIFAGTGTEKGINGADFWLRFFNRLPNNYIMTDEAKLKGWIPKKRI